MDTSETYIKMCDTEEIQKIWEPQDHDFYFLNKTGVEVITEGDAVLPHYGWATWLPRQDQLQAMIKHGIYESLVILESKMRQDIGYWGQFTSWEQLWLAFCMAEKFNKYWDGEEWE